MITLALVLSGCASIPSLSLESSSVEAVEWIAQISARNEVPSFSKTEEELIRSALSVGSSVIKQNQEDAVFSPLSYAAMKAMEGGQWEAVGSLTEKCNFELNPYLSLVCQNAMASLHEIAEETIEKSIANHVSVFIDPDLASLNGRLSRYFEREIALSDIDVAYINQLTLKDSFYEPWLGETLSFEGKEDMVFASNSLASCRFYENEFSTYLKIHIGRTELSIAYPKDGHTLSQINVEDWLGFVDYENATARIAIPEFRVSYDYAENGVPGVNITQSAEFSFDREGVRGQAISISAPTSSGQEPPHSFVVDRPFYFLSSFEGIPLFVGSFGK